MNNQPATLYIHLASSWFMVGLIWLVQLVHYPLMSFVEEARFAAFETEHRQRILFIVGPCMLMQLITAVILWRGSSSKQKLWLINLALIVCIWLSTFFIQVPLHDALNIRFTEITHQELVNSNWLRTILWTMQGLLAGYLFHQTVSARTVVDSKPS